MLNLGKIHKNLFIGVFVAFASIPSSLTIISNYILPVLKNSFGEFIFGNFIFTFLSLIVSIASFIWIKETIVDMEKTSRFMTKDEYRYFVIKTIVIMIWAILFGLIVSQIINN